MSREQPHHGAQRDTLARARFADGAEHFAGIERKVGAVDRTDRTLARRLLLQWARLDEPQGSSRALP